MNISTGTTVTVLVKQSINV